MKSYFGMEQKDTEGGTTITGTITTTGKVGFLLLIPVHNVNLKLFIMG